MKGVVRNCENGERYAVYGVHFIFTVYLGLYTVITLYIFTVFRSHSALSTNSPAIYTQHFYV